MNVTDICKSFKKETVTDNNRLFESRYAKVVSGFEFYTISKITVGERGTMILEKTHYYSDLQTNDPGIWHLIYENDKGEVLAKGGGIFNVGVVQYKIITSN